MRMGWARISRFRQSPSVGAMARSQARRGAGSPNFGRGRRRALRRASAVVEMAVVTPLLLTMVFGVMEFGWVLMMRETLTTATREAVRVRVLQGSTDTDARNRFNQAVAPTGLVVDPSNVAITQNGDIFTVTATVPYSQVSLVGNYLGFGAGNIRTTCSMRREGT